MPDDAYSNSVLSHNIPTELSRLQLLEHMVDPITRAAVTALPLERTWRCLDLGAGAGSVARWLGQRCPNGQVVAADIDTRFLEPMGNVSVCEFDVRTQNFPVGSFDLIHARAFFMHFPEREELLSKVATWLAPGGWLVAIDPDLFPLSSSPYVEWRRLVDGLNRLMTAHGADLHWARRRQPTVLANAGLVELGVSISAAVVGDDGPSDRFWRTFLAQSARQLIEDGFLSAEEIAAGTALLDDPEFFDLPSAFVTAWGRRPD